MPTITRQGPKQTRAVQNGASLWDSIQPVDKLPITGLKVLLFGLSGTGKSTMACTFPKPLLFIRPEQVEDGSLSIRTVAGVDAPPQLMTPNDLDDLCVKQAETGRYKTLVLDGVTKFQDIVLKKVLGLQDTPAQLSFGIADQQMWGIVSNEFKEHVRLLRLTGTGCNVIVVGGERLIEGSGAIKEPKVMVALQPATTGWLHEVCDYCIHTFVRRGFRETVTKVAGKDVKQREPAGIEFCSHVDNHDLYMTKFRKPKHVKLPEVEVDLDYAKVVKFIQGK